MIVPSRLLLSGLILCGLIAGSGTATAQLACGPFTTEMLAAPAPRSDPTAVARFEAINRAVKTEPHRVLFLGDSITERWDQPRWGAQTSWRATMVPRGVLNAGVSGDRTEHLLWRLDHGNLDGPPPRAIIVLIGTNDLGHGRPPELAAEGIRAVSLVLRQRRPDARILLLGLYPRGATADDPLRRAVVAVNRLIRGCGDGGAVTYGDIGDVLLDGKGELSRILSPDLLHFSGAGYRRLAPRLDALIDGLVGPP